MKLALRWAREGVPVFPCRPDDRAPRVEEGLYQATTDPSQIREWWTRWPDSLVGIACGKPGGFDIVDCDVDKDTGETVGENFIRGNYPHAWGLAEIIVKTPSGGYHLFFTPGSNLRNYVKSVTGCDVRTDGGYVIAAGEEGYAFHRGGFETIWDLNPAPDDLVAALNAKRDAREAEEFEDGRELDESEITPEIRSYVDSAIRAECIELREHEKGGRNHRLNEAAFKLGTLVGAGVLDYERAREELYEAALEAGLTPAESKKTIKSGLKSGEKKPRDLSDVGHDVLDDYLARYVYIELLDAIADLHRPESATPVPRTAFLVSTSADLHLIETHSPTAADPERVIDKWVPVAQSWLSHRDRKTVEDLTYRPGKARLCRDGLNIYEPPAYFETTRDDLLPPLWFEYLALLVPEEADRELLTRWMAHTVHRPQRRSPITPFLVTTHEGVGKGIFSQIMAKLVGRSNVSRPKMTALLGEFNEFLYQTTFAVVDEVAEGLDGRSRFVAMDSIRDTLTEPDLRVNIKRVSGRTERVYTNLLFLSNHSDAMAVREGDRRLFISISDLPPAPAEFYNRVLRIDPGKIASWLRQFVSEPLPNHAPLNASKLRMIAASTPAWVEAMADLVDGKSSLTTGDLANALFDSGQSVPADRALAREMERLGFRNKRVRVDGKQVRRWVRLGEVVDFAKSRA